jgi:uncharacterized protein YjbI with pentapeptide repeats
MFAPESGVVDNPPTEEIVGQKLEYLNWSGGSSSTFSCWQTLLSHVRLSGRSMEKMQALESDFAACRLDRFHCPALRLQAGQWRQCDCREMRAPQAWINHWQAQESQFHNADFQSACLHDTRFSNCELAGSNWQRALLINVRFETSNYLGRTDLRRTNFSRAVLMDVQLAGADFSGANLQGAIFVNVNLENAVLEDAVLENALFLGCRGKTA